MPLTGKIPKLDTQTLFDDMVVLESSIEVGTTERISSLIESKGFQVGKDFGLCFCPERIDPSNKEWGIENIPRVIYCSDDLSFEISKKIYFHDKKIIN